MDIDIEIVKKLLGSSKDGFAGYMESQSFAKYPNEIAVAKLALDFAKDYAASGVAKAQEGHLAYISAQVAAFNVELAAKDAEIERLEELAEIDANDGIARQKEAIRLGNEIAQLKAKNIEQQAAIEGQIQVNGKIIQQNMQLREVDIPALQASNEENMAIAQGLTNLLKGERDLLKRANARLREGIEKVMDYYNFHTDARNILNSLLLSPAEPDPRDGVWIGDMSNESFDKWLRILKTKGELTIREIGEYPFKIQSVGCFYESKSFGNYDLNDVIDWVSTHGGLEFLRPADGVGKGETCNCSFEQCKECFPPEQPTSDAGSPMDQLDDFLAHNFMLSKKEHILRMTKKHVSDYHFHLESEHIEWLHGSFGRSGALSKSDSYKLWGLVKAVLSQGKGDGV